MNKKKLLCANEAIAETAIQSGCKHYYGYPITPQNEISAYMAKRLPEVSGTFIQAESEIAAINMCFGTAATGKRTMTSSSGPGISLKQEGISYMAGCELPIVIVDVMRAGPGLGNITPSQSDYFQATRGGGHGDYRTMVLAPSSVQESADLTEKAFYFADKYRMPVLLLLDGMLGQLREPVVINVNKTEEQFDKSWCLTGCKDREQNIIRSLFLGDGVGLMNDRLQAKYNFITENESCAESYNAEDAELILIAYGTPARMCKSIVNKLRKEGIKIGLVRPITLWPFPTKLLRDTVKDTVEYLVVEWSSGQLIEDVKLSIGLENPVHFIGSHGGRIIELQEIENKISSIIEKNGVKI